MRCPVATGYLGRRRHSAVWTIPNTALTGGMHAVGAS